MQAGRTALERQDLSCTCPAHHQLESGLIIVVMVVITVTVVASIVTAPSAAQAVCMLLPLLSVYYDDYYCYLC